MIYDLEIEADFCVTCDGKCATCSDFDYCETCTAGNEVAYEGVCIVPSAPTCTALGFYFDSGNTVCIGCPDFCVDCGTDGACVQCEFGFFLNNAMCEETCNGVLKETYADNAE